MKRAYKGAIVDERQWIHAIQKGNREYLSDIAEKYYDDIFRFCAFQTGSREEACDLAQETFLRFIRYVEGYHDRNLKGYLLTIAMNVCRNWLRQKGREAAATVRYEEGWMPEPDGDAGMSPGCRHVHERHESRDSGYEPGGAALDDRADRAAVYGRRTESAKNGAAFRGEVDDGPGLGGYFNPEQCAVEADVHNRLMQALGQLPEMQREAVLLHYIYDMKYREIGRATGASVSTVKSRVRQGVEKLQGILRREDFLD